jgi:hypothetical protein
MFWRQGWLTGMCRAVQSRVEVERMGRKKVKAPTTLRDILPVEIQATGKTVLQVSKESGVSHPVLYRFLNGTRKELHLTTVDKLLRFLDLEVRRK